MLKLFSHLILEGQILKFSSNQKGSIFHDNDIIWIARTLISEGLIFKNFQPLERYIAIKLLW